MLLPPLHSRLEAALLNKHSTLKGNAPDADGDNIYHN